MDSIRRKYANKRSLTTGAAKIMRGFAAIALVVALVPLCSCSSSSSEPVDPAQRVVCDTPFDSFSSESAETVAGVSVDTSHIAEGYVGIAGQNESRLKIQLGLEHVRTYELDNTGEPCFYPFHDGDGTYELTIYRNTSGDNYVALSSMTIDVHMVNEFQPWMHAGYYVKYTEESSVVSQAAQITANCTTDTEKVRAIFDYLSNNVTYDDAFAKSVGDGYVPDPDTTLTTKKGICFDYASTAAAMIRSVGIPCKLITGYVSPNDRYHAWNMVYLQDKGWVEANIDVSSKDWNRIDVTFAATGGDSTFVGDGQNYTTRYEY